MDQEEYKDSLINFDLKSFLEEYSVSDILSLRRSFPVHYRLLAEQLKLYPKALKKLPVFAKHLCYFTAKSLEQSSSEALAVFKAGLFSGKILLDLTGGLGVDDRAFSFSFDKVISVDSDKELNSLVRINFEKLRINNIERIDSTAEEYIKKQISAELIYIDADRRSKKGKGITIADSEPPVLKILSRLFELSDTVLLKLSPLIDITYLGKTLPNPEKIYVISLYNEVKEILVLLKTGHNESPLLIAVDIDNEGNSRTFSEKTDTLSEARISENINKKYFYEPSRSIIKAGLTGGYAIHMGLEKINAGGVYLLGDELLADFRGRVFRIIKGSEFRKSLFKKYLKENRIFKANIARRNFPLSAEEIKKQYKLTDGGEEYLFFTAEDNGKKLFFHCRKH